MNDHDHESVHAALVAHLRGQAIAFTEDGAASVHFLVADPLGAIQVVCTFPASDVLVVRSWYPHPIDAIDLPPVEQLCLLANARLQIGSLDVDRQRAAVCFRTGVDFAGATPGAAMIGRAIDTSLAGMVRWMPPIASVANGLSVDLAIQVVDP